MKAPPEKIYRSPLQNHTFCRVVRHDINDTEYLRADIAKQQLAAKDKKIAELDAALNIEWNGRCPHCKVKLHAQTDGCPNCGSDIRVARLKRELTAKDKEIAALRPTPDETGPIAKCRK